MIYISKGIVQEKSTERNIYVARCGQVFHLNQGGSSALVRW